MTQRKQASGRGSSLTPPNRFERIHVEDDFEQLEDADILEGAGRKVATAYYVDDSQSIVSQNSSPDIGFDFSVNPYRGCAHGWLYFCIPPQYNRRIRLLAGGQI